MTELPSLNILKKIYFDILNANLFVKQPDKTLLGWFGNKWINYLNAKINIKIIFLSYNCD